MHREVLRAVVLTALLAGTAQACSNHSDDATAMTIGPRTAKQAALLSWKPRVWAPPTAIQPVRVTTASAGMRVERDPVDGSLSMPQPDPFEQLVEVGERRPVNMTRLPSGRLRAQLDESFHEYAVVRIGADGKPRWTCVSPAGVEQFLKTAAVPAPAPGTKWEDK